MPFPKILAPLLPNKRSKQSKATEFVLSPAALPLSPPCQQNAALTINDNGDPVIEVSTTYEETSNCSQDTLDEQSDVNEVTENAVVLHEKPTTFDLCDNDLIIDSMKDAEEEQEELETFEKEMMRDSHPSTVVETEAETEMDEATKVYSYAPEIEVAPSAAEVKVNPYAPEIDFAPPAEFMSKEDDVNPFDAPFPEEVSEATLVSLPPSPPIVDVEEPVEEIQAEFTAPIQAKPTQPTFISVEPAQVQVDASRTEFIQSVPTEQVSNIFSTAASEPEANFTMETTFRRTNTVKSKWRKLLSSAKGLVCKSDLAENEDNNRIKSLFDSKLETVLSTAGQESANDNKEQVPFVSSFDKQAEEDAKTPIYRRRNTSHTSIFHMEEDQPPQAYKSPVIGSEAYNIKMLCEQSFFGRW